MQQLVGLASSDCHHQSVSDELVPDIALLHFSVAVESALDG
jgi:hypothetical protein